MKRYPDAVASTVALEDLIRSIPPFRLKQALLEHLNTKGATLDTYAFVHNVAIEAQTLVLETPKFRK